MIWHGIGYPPQPSPLHVVVSRDSLLYPPCRGAEVVLPRAGLDIDASQQAVGPASWLWWRDDLRATVNGLSVSWLRAQRP